MWVSVGSGFVVDRDQGELKNDHLFADSRAKKTIKMASSAPLRSLVNMEQKIV